MAFPKSVSPEKYIVIRECFTITPIPPSILVTFLIGAVLLIAGMLLFNVGVESSMTPIGERVGSIMTRSKNVFIMIAISFVMGMVITISEPDLQVLAQQIPSIPNMTLIIAVALGVGMFLVISILRMLFSIPLSYLLLFCYGIVFVLTMFVPQDFLAIAFDSGGVTTGPMTVPFIMSFGVGIAAIRSDRHAEDDSFGLVALCSVGPILAVLLLGMIFTPGATETVSESIPIIDNTVDIGKLFLVELQKDLAEASKLSSEYFTNRTSVQVINDNVNNLKSYIGLRIKFIRNTRHMTITDVAKQLGVSRKQYQNYEQGKTDIRVSRLNEIAKIFQINPNLFFSGYEDDINISDENKKFLINFSRIKSQDVKNAISRLMAELI